MTDRLACCVPGCRRSIAREGEAAAYDEWICPTHWRLVGSKMRRAWARIRRIKRRFGDEAVPVERHSQLWRRLKREAIGPL